MEITVSVSTDKIGSTMERTIHVDDEELVDMSESDQEAYFEEVASEKLFDMIQWDWRKA